MFVNNDKVAIKSDSQHEVNMLVARNMRRFRLERAMSLGEVSRRSGLSKQTLSKIELGEGNGETVHETGFQLSALSGRRSA